MKKKILFDSFLFVLVTIISIGVMSCATRETDTAQNCDERLITVLNPAISNKMAERVPLTPRTGTLEGKTIYLVTSSGADLRPATASSRKCRTGFHGTCLRSRL